MTAVDQGGAAGGVRLAASGTHWLAYAPVWVVFCVLVVVLLAARGVVTTIYTHDLYVVFDGAWRTYLHELPYRDFHSPVGIAYYLPYLLLRQIEAFSLTTLLHANAVVAFGLLILATLTLPRRMPPLFFFVTALAIVTVVISPHAADWPWRIFSHLAPYNRWCEAATMLLAAVVLLAPRDTAADGRVGPSARADHGAAVTIALLALFVLYVKVTYFLCAVGLTGLGLLTRQTSFRTIAIATALVLAVAALLEATLHLHRPYFEDLDMARRATLEVHGHVDFLNRRSGAVLAAIYSAAVVGLLLLCAPRQAWPRLPRRCWVALAIAMPGCVFAALTNMQNHTQLEIPLMGTILLVAGELIRRGIAFTSLPGWRRAVFVAVMGVGAASGIVIDSASLVAHTIASRDGSACPIPAWRGTPGEQLLFHQLALTRAPAAAGVSCAEIDVATLLGSSAEALIDAPLEAARLTEARSLLQGRQGAHDRVIAMDFASPYSVFTATLPANGALLWWDFGRDYSSNHRPDPMTLLRGVDFVLESRHDRVKELHGEHMWTVYGAEVMRSFAPVAEGPLWRLWQRRGPVARQQ